MPVSVDQELATYCQEAGIIAKHALVARHKTQISKIQSCYNAKICINKNNYNLVGRYLYNLRIVKR